MIRYGRWKSPLRPPAISARAAGSPQFGVRTNPSEGWVQRSSLQPGLGQARRRQWQTLDFTAERAVAVQSPLNRLRLRTISVDATNAPPEPLVAHRVEGAIVDSYVVDPESKWLQQIAIVRDKDENALTQRVNEKLAEIKIEGGKLREIRFLQPRPNAGNDSGLTVIAVYDVPPTLPA